LSAIRVRFTRGHEVKFISHLDLMKAFERALRRSGLPIAYSQGFNPHPQMVFGLPLSVGVVSVAEYADFELTGDINPIDFSNKLNVELPQGIKITAAKYKYAKGNIMAKVNAAVYDVDIFLDSSISLEAIKEKLSLFMNETEIPVEKEIKGGKKGKDVIKTVDIRPMIKKLELSTLAEIPSGYEEFVSAFRITALLSAGSASNVKPELVVSAFDSMLGLNIRTYLVYRRELFVDNNGGMANPLNDAVLMERKG